MKKRHRTKRERVKHRAPARVFRVALDHDLPFHVELRIARTRSHMRAETARLDGTKGREGDLRTMGLVKHYTDSITGAFVYRPGGMVARMYLNVRDLRDRPSEIVAHECGHAAMAWARLRGANLRRMPGEEVMCYALGRLVSQVNRCCYAAGVW